MASSCAEENYTVKLNTGEVNPALGMSYIQFAVEGLRHQLSQGAGGWSVDAGPHYAYYKLLDTAEGKPDAKLHEKDFYDGIDTSLPGLAARLGDEEKKVAFLRPALAKIASEIEQAAGGDPASAGCRFVFCAGNNCARCFHRLSTAVSAPRRKPDLLQRLREKSQQAETALDFAVGIGLDAVAVIPSDGSAAVSPGQKVEVRRHRSQRRDPRPIEVNDVALEGFENWGREFNNKTPAKVEAGKRLYG